GETMGSTQRLPNGNTVIGWGGVTTGHIRIASEVNPDGEVEFEMSFPKGVTFQTTSYRVYKFPYPPNIPDAIVTKNEISSIVSPNIPLYDTLEFNVDGSETGVKIVFDELIDESHSKITVEKYSYAPLYPRFDVETPLVNSCKIIIKSEKINKFEGTIVIDLSKYPMLLHRKKLSLWRRIAMDSLFVQLPSLFDEENMVLSAKTKSLDGEYIIATTDFRTAPEPPILTQPKDSSVLNSTKAITFYWTPQNHVTSSEIMIARDVDFVNVVYNTNGLKSNMFEAPPLSIGKYFWRVRCSNPYGQSNWSDVYTFEIKEPFLTMKSPKQNDIFEKEKSCLIEWEHNLSPEFMLTLYKDNKPYFNIIDSIYSFYGKYEWIIPDLIPSGENYKIRVTSIKDNKLFAESEIFSIQEPSGVHLADNSIKVYPNPASSTIEIVIKSGTIGSLTVLDLFGNELRRNNSILNENDRISIDLKDFSSGMYLLKIQNGNNLIIEKVYVIRD
ncbi:MAG: T9SS type A sorting domain-containing protein, partial [Candidatus Kapaibacteriota bacterium]